MKEASVVGFPHPKWQDRPLAAVVLEDGARATLEELFEEGDFVEFADGGARDSIEENEGVK